MRISCCSNRRRGMSLVEMVVAVGVGSVVLSSSIVVFIYSLFSFAGLGNYAILTGQSKLSLDLLSRDMRECTGVLASSEDSTTKSITLTNAFAGTISRYTWQGETGALSWEKTGEQTRTILTGCDQWDFTFYQRTPTAGWNFYTNSDFSRCKLINMDWKCSRSILGRKINTETIVTAQIVLRNS